MFDRSSFQTCVIPALVSFKHFFFFYFGLIFKCHTHRIEKIPFGFLDAEFYAKSLKKKSLKKMKYSRSSPDPENSQSGNQQPYNLSFVFANFRTLPENLGKPKLVDSMQKN